MSGSGGAAGEAQRLRERLARFRDAALRVNESLDLDAVLQGVLDSARELTGGRYALISLVDGNGVLTECLTSGMTAAESQEFLHQMPDRWELYDFLIGVTEPVRIDDFGSYLQAHELPEFSPPFEVSEPMAYLAAPIRHSGERTGVIYVAEKPAGFNPDDEETLAVFASLAALVISNARRFEGERRARADLEGVVTTAPMIVVVFDADTGAVTSLNHRARRLMGDLDVSFETVEELTQAGRFRLGDGRDVSADGVSLQKLLLSPDPVRDVEVTAEFADGRSVALLVNATPIVDADNRAESVVVAAQDMTPLTRLERMRSQFLAMIGRELRSPLAAIKGSAATLLHSVPNLGEAETVQFLGIIDTQADHTMQLLSSLLDAEHAGAGAADSSLEPVPPAGPSPAVGARGPQPAARAPAGSSDPPAPARFEFGDLSIDYRAQLVHVAGGQVDLAPVEYRLLAHLAANAGTLVPHHQLIAAVWGPATATDANRLRTAIKNLRHKLGDDARNPRYIFTGARVGYRMPNPD